MEVVQEGHQRTGAPQQAAPDNVREVMMVVPRAACRHKNSRHHGPHASQQHDEVSSHEHKHRMGGLLPATSHQYTMHVQSQCDHATESDTRMSRRKAVARFVDILQHIILSDRTIRVHQARQLSSHGHQLGNR
eukprot:scaffold1687_cov405-Prasinococcus_capsulatus_cf.AAC.38